METKETKLGNNKTQFLRGSCKLSHQVNIAAAYANLRNTMQNPSSVDAAVRLAPSSKTLVELKFCVLFMVIGPEKVGGVALIKSSLAIELSPHFEYKKGDQDNDPPTHFNWKGICYQLDNSMWKCLRSAEVDELIKRTV